MPVATQRQVQYIDNIDDTIQSMLKHMVEKVEMNTAMLAADIEERADQDECRRNVDDEFSDLRRETVSGRQQSPRWTSEAQPGVSTDLNTTPPQTRRAHCDAQDNDAPPCMETDAHAQGREHTHPGRVCS